MPIQTRRAKLKQPNTATAKKTTVDRSMQVRRDKDDVKIPTSELEKLDQVFKSFIIDAIQPTIQDPSGNTVQVPVMYTDSEKWANVQSHGYIRDAKNKALPPIIAFRRNDVERREDLSRPVANKSAPEMLWYVKKKYSTNNQYTRFTTQSKLNPTAEFYGIVFPDFVRIYYDVIIWTEYISQVNTMVERFIYHNGDAHGQEYKHHIWLDSNNLETINSSGEDRLVRANLSLHLDGAIILEKIEKNKVNPQKLFAPRKLVLTEKEIDDQNIEDYENKFK